MTLNKEARHTLKHLLTRTVERGASNTLMKRLEKDGLVLHGEINPASGRCTWAITTRGREAISQCA